LLVRLQGDISGTRDGQPWPPRGTRRSEEDLEAIDLCRNGMAVPVPADEVEVAVVPADDVEVRGALTTDSAAALGRRRKA
jgi:hypothetical protein